MEYIKNGIYNNCGNSVRRSLFNHPPAVPGQCAPRYNGVEEKIEDIKGDAQGVKILVVHPPNEAGDGECQSDKIEDDDCLSRVTAAEDTVSFLLFLAVRDAGIVKWTDESSGAGRLSDDTQTTTEESGDDLM
eukprot:scaffold10886_cov116-Skeletonema_marinoi.AAC.3